MIYDQSLLLKLCRYTVIVALGFALSGPAPSAVALCNFNDICEPNLDENAGNCIDCGWCGDSVCQSGELCQQCPDDCYAQCVCGDGTCSWPAEGAGEGSAEDCSYSPIGSNCRYCGLDCVPACNYMYCDFSYGYGPSCNPDNGRCEECEDSSYCPNPFNYECQNGVCVWVPMCPAEGSSQ